MSVQRPIERSESGQYLSIDGLRLHYVSEGKGSPVVFLHGNPGFLQDFSQTILTPVARKLHAIAFDRPGHGLSERPSTTATTVEVQARLLKQALHQLGVSPCVVVGHSWGGALALAYALNYPSDVRALVLVAPAAYPGPDSFGVQRTLATVPVLGDIIVTLGSPFIKKEIETGLKRAFSPADVPTAYLRLAETLWMRPDNIKAILEDDQSLNKSLEVLSPRYGEIHQPVAIITGDSDLEVVPEDNAHRLHDAITQSRLIVLSRAGHELLHTHGEVVVDSISQQIL